jgi:hypothetical protein
MVCNYPKESPLHWIPLPTLTHLDSIAYHDMAFIFDLARTEPARFHTTVLGLSTISISYLSHPRLVFKFKTHISRQLAPHFLLSNVISRHSPTSENGVQMAVPNSKFVQLQLSGLGRERFGGGGHFLLPKGASTIQHTSTRSPPVVPQHYPQYFGYLCDNFNYPHLCHKFYPRKKDSSGIAAPIWKSNQIW